jgi:(S)-mandelate dehydrogenase
MGRLLLCPRRFGGVVTDTSVELFGHRYDQPFGVAPLGMANLCWPDTDLTLARLSEQHNVPYVLSTAGTTSIEKIAEVAPTVAWFQLYLSRDEAITTDMMTRAWRSGIRVLVLTVDVPYPGRRNRSIRDRFSLPFVITPRLVSDLATHPCWSVATLAAGIPTLTTYTKYAKSDNLEVVGNFIAQLNKNGFGWDDLRRVRDQWKGKLVVKGVLDPNDATAIREAGADGIWVSNQGGRQLESAPATIDMLGDIRIASGPSFPVLFDGGIRSGEDIIKARALGATMVFSGRCFAHGCAAGADSGAARAFEILAVELVFRSANSRTKSL